MHHICKQVYKANHSSMLQETSSILGLGPHGQQPHLSEACIDHVAKISCVEPKQAEQATFGKSSSTIQTKKLF